MSRSCRLVCQMHKTDVNYSIGLYFPVEFISNSFYSYFQIFVNASVNGLTFPLPPNKRSAFQSSKEAQKELS